MIYQTTPNTTKVNVVAKNWLILSLCRVIDSQSRAKIEFFAKNTKNHDFEIAARGPRGRRARRARRAAAAGAGAGFSVFRRMMNRRQRCPTRSTKTGQAEAPNQQMKSQPRRNQEKQMVGLSSRVGFYRTCRADTYMYVGKAMRRLIAAAAAKEESKSASACARNPSY